MYKIYADDVLIYDDTSSDTHLKVVSPNLSLEDNCAGSLKITIPPGNAGYDTIQRMITEIKVTKDDNEIWSGRVLQESKDFWNRRSLVCEGELAYFNDTVQPPHSYSYAGPYGVKNYLIDLITNHNQHVSEDKRFGVDPSMMVVTVYGRITVDTNYEKTIECINNLISEKGGHLKIEKIGGVRYLNYYGDWPDTSAQKIEFGRNLMDVTKSSDSTEFATVILPLGKKLEDKDPGGLDQYLTVDGADEEGGTTHSGVYVESELVGTYGWIVKVVHWDDIDDKNELLANAKEYLNGVQSDTIELELSALDLHYMSKEIPTIRLGDRVYVTSKPHGIEDVDPFPVTKLDIPLDQPQNTKFRLGSKITTSLTAVNNKINEEIKKAIDNAVDEDAILNQAKANTNAIMNQTLNGYVTIFTENDPDTGVHSEGLYISDTSPLTKTDPPNPNRPYSAQRMWKWTVAGLGYSDDYGATWKAAITMDGSILGERIAAGSIHGSKITAGTLALVTESGAEECKIRLEVIGLTKDELDIGTIDRLGRNQENVYYARMINKKQIASGQKIKVNTYGYSVYRYTDNDDPESGFYQVVGTYDAGVECTIPQTDYYRITIYYDGNVVTKDDLATIGALVNLGSSTVVSSADIRIDGMVTFTSLRDDLANEGGTSTTVINGGLIKTNTVTADKINIKGLTVTKKVDASDVVTFHIDNNGNVTLSSDSVISFTSGSPKTLGDIADEEIAKSIANGSYSGGSFIKEKIIYGPTIIANEFVAQALPAAKSGRFVLKDGQEHERLYISYNSDSDSGPHIEFGTNADSGIFYFTKPIQTRGLNDLGSSDKGHIYGREVIHGSLKFRGAGSGEDDGESSFGNGGRLVLGYNTTYVSTYSDLTSLPNPVAGQICFLLN